MNKITFLLVMVLISLTVHADLPLRADDLSADKTLLI